MGRVASDKGIDLLTNGYHLQSGAKDTADKENK